MNAEYIRAEEMPMLEGKKTRRWMIISKVDGTALGVVKWFARWYAYAFYPHAETIFEKTCLRDIAQFCEDETKAHKSTWNRTAH